jgi:hypothetical protein
MTGEQLGSGEMTPLVLSGVEALQVGVASLIERRGKRYLFYPTTDQQKRADSLDPDELAVLMEERKKEAA